MKKIKLILCFALIAIGGNLFSQTLIVTDDPAYTTGNASSVLDVKSSAKGFLAPRMLQTERSAILSPSEGLLVYQTDGTKGFYYYNGVTWILVASGTISNYLPLAGGTLTGKLNTLASSTANAGLILPHGVAPTAPVNGDLWTTTTGIFARINGATVGPFGTGTENALTFTSPIVRTTNTISIPPATGSVSGYLTSTDWTTFNGKLSSALASGNIFVGNGSNIATGIALSGDATILNTGALTLANSGVTAAQYGNTVGTIPSVTLDAKGRITAASNRTIVDNDIPDNITASNYMPLAGGALTGELDANGGFKLGSTGTVLQKIIKTSVTVTNNTNITNNAPLTLTVTVTGATLNASVIVNPTSALTSNLGIAYSYVSAANTVKIIIICTNGTKTLGTVIFDITIIQ